MSDSLGTHGLQHARLPCPLSTPGACSNSCQSRRWCHPTILSSAAHFCSCLQSIPESGSFPMSQFFASDGQSIGVPASASGLPMTIQDWFPLGLMGLVSLLSKGLSRVFSKTTVQKHKFFDAVLFLFLFLFFYSPTLKSIMTTEKAIALCQMDLCWWFHLHIWSYWYFSQQSWSQLVLHPAWHLSWCTLCIS